MCSCFLLKIFSVYNNLRVLILGTNKTKVLLCVCVYKLLSRVQLFAAPWTVDCQAPLSMEFSRQKY